MGNRTRRKVTARSSEAFKELDVMRRLAYAVDEIVTDYGGTHYKNEKARTRAVEWLIAFHDLPFSRNDNKESAS